MTGSAEFASEFLGIESGDAVRCLQHSAHHPALDRLVSRTTRNYFRLLEAERQLRARVHRAPQAIGTILADSLDADRRRIGRELHTSVGQSLAAIHMHLNLLEEQLSGAPEDAGRNLNRIRGLAATALDQVRGVSRRLYVAPWEALRLADALRDLWETSGIPEKYFATLDLFSLSIEPPLPVRRAIYLAAQEAISNVSRHSNARHVRMSLREQAGRIALEVADDGHGFDMPQSEEPRAPAGIGLRCVRDLANELGGEFYAGSTPQGATLTLSFPVTHE